jgi:hypothetical protein
VVTPLKMKFVRGKSSDNLRTITSQLSPELQRALREQIESFTDRCPDSHPATSVLRKTAFKKYSGGKRNPTLALVAKHAFLETEKHCADTNRRVRSWIHTNKSYADPVVLHMATRKISSILGNFSIREMCDKARFGPGSTFAGRGEDVSWARKFSLTDVTPEFNKTASSLLSCYFQPWVNSIVDSEHQACPILDVVPGGRYSTVAKNETTDRSIIVEPTINSFFQQGLGGMIRARLMKACGVDLNDQSTNQRLAKLGSLTDDLATVDLSSASDLISKDLVQDLLPEEWFWWMNLTRSRRVFIDGQWVTMEKFSTMGNGFSFDLESLIFYALTWAVTVRRGYNPFWVNVFGDDIVVPSAVEEDFKQVFQNCGFKVNTEKSYFAGPFRESCGHDYHLGENVRGVYITSLSNALDVLKVHNRFFEWTLRTGISTEQLRTFMVNSCKILKQYRTPNCLGDVGISSHFDEVCPPIARDGWEGFRIRTIQPVLRTRTRDDRFLLLQRLAQRSVEFDQGNSLALRLTPAGYREKEIISLWD